MALHHPADAPETPYPDSFDRSLHSTGGINRREVLAGLALLLAGTLPSVATAEAEKEEPNHDQNQDMEKKFAQDFAEHPEKFVSDPVWLDAMMTLNFLDAVGALARHKPPLLNGLLTGLVRLGGARLHQIADGIHEYDHHFPHTSLFAGLALNVLRAQQSKKAHEEVLHGLQEAGLGVGMLLFATSVGAGIRTREETFLSSIHTHDQAVVETAESASGSPVERINVLVRGIPAVVGAAPIAAALTQFPLLAFGNARIAKDKMLGVKRLSDTAFAAVIGMTGAQVLSILSGIENPVIRQILQDVAAGKEGLSFTTEDAGKMSDAYMQAFGVGMLSGTMDVTQAAFGDMGPSVVGATQSFGAEQMLKTGLSNILYTIVIGYEESIALARRLGVPVTALINRKTQEDALTMCMRCWVNLGAYVTGMQGSPHGARFGIIGQVGEDLEKIFRMGMQAICVHARTAGRGVDDILARRGKHILSEIQDTRNGLLSDIVRNLPDLPGQKASARAALATAGVLSFTNARTNDGDVDAAMGDGDQQRVIDGMDTLNVLLKEIGDSTPDRVQADKFLAEIHNFLEALGGITCENHTAQADMHATLHRVAELFETQPSYVDLLKFEYWEKHLGPEMAETAFVVFLQGIHIVGLTPAISRVTYGRRDALGAGWERVFGSSPTSHAARWDAGLLGSMALHGGVSSVADNWADELIHAKQLSRDVFLPWLCEKYGIAADAEAFLGLPINYSQIITGQYTQVTIMVEEHLRTQGREAEIPTMQKDVNDCFLITKHMAILSAVMGGGESTIGNSPHFSAVVGELKRMVTLGASFADIIRFWPQHLARLGITFASARYAGPFIERQLADVLSLATGGGGDGNPFLPANRGTYVPPAPGAH